MKTDILFSRREREVVECIVRGYSLRATAEQLNVVYQCVANHIQSIYDKAGIFDRRTLNSLTSWWFQTNYDIDIKELRRRTGTACLLILFCSYTLAGGDFERAARRVRRGRETRIEGLIEN